MISGSNIFFSTGESERLRIAKKKVSLRMDGETHIGIVNDEDNVILWSDGDMWFFVGTSPPPRREVVCREECIKKRYFCMCAAKLCVKKSVVPAADSDDD